LNSDTRVETLLKNKIGEEAFDIERVYFVKTDRKSNPRKTDPFRYFAGDLPVLLSAPHSVRHIRHKRIKPSDEFTGSIICMLNKLTGCHGLAVAKLYGGDPNFDDKCIYKDFLKNLTATANLRLIIDVHGASREHDFDIDIGTIKGKSLLGRNRIQTLLKEAMEYYGINKISENRFSVSGQNTITAYASQNLGIPAVQLEINKRFRVPHQNPQDYCRVVGALSDLIGWLTAPKNPLL